ncbi:ATP-grasp domain-containing protein [Flavisolibacter sp. BT320]|nr:ATP-grasp domain-containing protein [Flavisolibacter longurius]
MHSETANATAPPLLQRPGNDRGEKDTERKKFAALQNSFLAQFEQYFPDKLAPKTVVVIPSLTLDPEILGKIEGVNYYEERMLCMLLLLRMPNTHVVFITSMPIDPVILDYYLHLLPGITAYHARQRLTLLSCFDSSSLSLTQKILNRPKLVRRIRDSIPPNHMAHLSCFTVTEAERKLANALDLPVYGCNPDLAHLGNKSNGRKLFRSCHIPTPRGVEDLHTKAEIIEALFQLKQSNPHLRKAVVKINEGFSGEGNAVFSFAGAPFGHDLEVWLWDRFTEQLQVIARGLSVVDFLEKFCSEGGIVEEFIDGEIKQSPSVQCRINPLGIVDVISTHDQALGGENGQVYLGASFPANAAYAKTLAQMGRTVAEELKNYGVLGRFAIDFISVKEGEHWKHYAIEINLRKGGTTHPYLMLQFLTCGKYNAEEGVFYTANGYPRYYRCTDNLQDDRYKGLTPHDLIDIAMCNELMYDGTLQEGVMFHLISALSQYGKLGIVCIGATPERASFFYHKTVHILNGAND